MKLFTKILWATASLHSLKHISMLFVDFFRKIVDIRFEDLQN